MMGSPRRADGWPLAVPVGPLGGARPWEDTLGVEWGLAPGTRQGGTEEGGAAPPRGLLAASSCFPPWWVWRWGCGAPQPTLL